MLLIRSREYVVRTTHLCKQRHDCSMRIGLYDLKVVPTQNTLCLTVMFYQTFLKAIVSVLCGLF